MERHIFREGVFFKGGGGGKRLDSLAMTRRRKRSLTDMQQGEINLALRICNIRFSLFLYQQNRAVFINHRDSHLYHEFQKQTIPITLKM